jgi:hypothetical protein
MRLSRQNQVGILVALLALLAVVLYYEYRSPEVVPGVAVATDKYSPMEIENPSLRLDKIESVRGIIYAGRRRNIFSASAPQSEQPKVDVTPPVPSGPPPEVPLVVPAKFFGYVADAQTGSRRAFFASSNGEDVFILAEGETLLSRFRLLRITNNAADVEEIGTGKRATLVLEEPRPSA